MAGFSCFAESTLCAGADAGFSAGLAVCESVLSDGAASGAGSVLLKVASLDGFEGFSAPQQAWEPLPPSRVMAPPLVS